MFFPYVTSTPSTSGYFMWFRHPSFGYKHYLYVLILYSGTDTISGFPGASEIILSPHCDLHSVTGGNLPARVNLIVSPPGHHLLHGCDTTSLNLKHNRGCSSVAERPLRMRKVAGSIPVSSSARDVREKRKNTSLEEGSITENLASHYDAQQGL